MGQGQQVAIDRHRPERHVGHDKVISAAQRIQQFFGRLGRVVRYDVERLLPGQHVQTVRDRLCCTLGQQRVDPVRRLECRPQSPPWLDIEQEGSRSLM